MPLTLVRAFVFGVALPALMAAGSELRLLGRQQPSSSPDSTQQKSPDKQEQKKPEQPDYSISVEVPLVTVDVVATDNSGNFITGLKKENFRILEDGVPQTITNFAPTDAPITIALLVEFSKLGYYWYGYNATDWAYGFLGQLNKDDWVALETFDLKPRIEVDFTRNKDEVRQALAHLIFPGFSESNVFDALLDTVDRLQDVKGKKAILLLASGVDTFSKNTLDQSLKRLRQTDVSIFSIGISREAVEYLDARGYLSGAARLNFYQAENQLRTFANMTGGRAWFPRFQGELPSIFRDVAASLRNQYGLGYTPANKNRDGKFRKIKVELVAQDGSPLVVMDQRGKKVKYVVYAREGYVAPKGSVGD